MTYVLSTLGVGYLTQPVSVLANTITSPSGTTTFGNPVVLPNGTAADPSLTFAGDSGSNGDGMYWDTGTSAPRLVADGGYALQWANGSTTLNGTVIAPSVSVSGTLTTTASRVATPPTAQSLTAVTDAITVGAADYNAPFTATGALVLTSAPTIANGVDGQEILLINVGANAVTISDQGTLAGSNLRLDAVTIALASRHSIRLMYSTVVGDWVQVGPVTAVI